MRHSGSELVRIVLQCEGLKEAVSCLGYVKRQIIDFVHILLLRNSTISILNSSIQLD